MTLEELEVENQKLRRMKELLEGALEFEKERANGLAGELEQHEVKARWCCCTFCFDRIEMLEAENKRLFDAHSVEMVRADALKQELEWLQQETDDE